MALSSGARNALSEAIVWVSCAGVFIASLVYMDEIIALGSHLRTDTAVVANADERATEPLQDRADNDDSVSTSSGVELHADRRGQFSADAQINGMPVSVLVDTGATSVALTHEDARAAGIFLSDGDYTHTASTANGTARVAPVMLSDITIGNITVNDVRAVVIQRGRLKQTLLGMSFLNRLSRVNLRAGRLILEE